MKRKVVCNAHIALKSSIYREYYYSCICMYFHMYTQHWVLRGKNNRVALFIFNTVFFCFFFFSIRNLTSFKAKQIIMNFGWNDIPWMCHVFSHFFCLFLFLLLQNGCWCSFRSLLPMRFTQFECIFEYKCIIILFSYEFSQATLKQCSYSLQTTSNHIYAERRHHRSYASK